MPAYVFANIEVTDPVLYEEYRKGVPATIAQYGGRFVARGGAAEGLEGGYVPKRGRDPRVPERRAREGLVGLARVPAASRAPAARLARRSAARRGPGVVTIRLVRPRMERSI